MVTEHDSSNRHAITCLYCGASTVLSPSHVQRLSAEAEAPQKSPVLLIRCPRCFKEAPYGRQNMVIAAAAAA